MDNKAPIEGDVRYLPVSWTCGTGKGDLNETNAYARTLQFTTAGTYTLNVTYERQLYKDGKWIAKGDADVQTVQLNVTGNTITNSTNKGASGSNSNVRVAAVTGDNSPIVLLSIGACSVSCSTHRIVCIRHTDAKTTENKPSVKL